MKWFKDAARRRYEAKERRRRMWRVHVANDIEVSVPNAMHGEDYEAWGRLQARMLSRFHEHWPGAHTYFMVATYDPDLPRLVSGLVTPGKFEKVATQVKDRNVYWFPDCDNEKAWGIILGTMAGDHYGKAVYVLDRELPDWRRTLEDLFKRLTDVDTSVGAGGSERELSDFRCLCYSVDEDLWFVKVDLPEADVLSNLEELAREEGFDLVVERVANQPPNSNGWR